MRLFNPRQALAEIEKQGLPPASSASSASLTPISPPKEAKEAKEAASGGEVHKNGPQSQNLSKPQTGPMTKGGAFSNIKEKSVVLSPYGTSPGGRPLTHTGKVVSLDAWRHLSEWEKHGSDSKLWNGKSQQWEVLE